VSCTPFTNELPIPPVLTPKFSTHKCDFYEITMKEADVEILCDGIKTRIWGYNGLFPGPTIKARPNRKVIVKQKNHLSVHTSIHLHGGHTPPDSDGHPNDMIMPGESKIYTYPNTQVGTTLWYHDHVDMDTHFNVYMGLAGFYLIEDDDIELPEAIPLVLQDRDFGDDGELVYNAVGPTGELLAEHVIVNGKFAPFLRVPTKMVRFRILNGSNSRFYRLSLTSSAGDAPTWTKIGTEGGLMHAPLSGIGDFVLAPAERVDVIVNFAGRLGEKITLHAGGNNECAAEGGVCPANDPDEIMQFHVDIDQAEDFVLPATLRPMELLNPADAVNVREFDLEQDPVTTLWKIGGRSFDPTSTVVMPNINDIEVWKFNNLSPRPHPMHVHLVQAQIYATEKDGVETLFTDDQRRGLASDARSLQYGGIKETAFVPKNAGQWNTVSWVMKFRGDTTHTTSCNEFPYVFHCHKLEHEDHGMMDNFAVIDPDNPTCPPPRKKHKRRHRHHGHGHHCHHDHGGGHCRCFRRGEGPGHHGGDHDDHDDPHWFLHVDEDA
jgi:spore coat protein A